MKTASFFLLCMLVCGLVTVTLAQNPYLKFDEIQRERSARWNTVEPAKGDGYKPYKRWEHYWESRLMPDGSFPPAGINRTNWNAYLKNQTTPEGSPAQANWAALGPNSSPGGEAGMGRVNCIAFAPNAPNTIWVGTPAGGLWRSTDNGNTWTPMTDQMEFSGVTAIAIDPTNADRMLIATGDAFGENVPSSGVWRSTDGGVTWAPTGLSFNREATAFVRQLIFHPTNANILLAATSQGISRSTDGGQTWQQVLGGNFWDLRFHPANPNIAYAASGNALFRSNTGGQTWVFVQDVLNSGRIALAVTPANPNLVLALSSTTWQAGGNFNGLFASTNAGATYVQRSNTPNILNNTPTGAAGVNGQGMYDLCIAISPTNANLVFVGGVNLWRSGNGGIAWTLINFWNSVQAPAGVAVVHADKHCLAWKPGTGELYQGNDGGIYVSTNNGTAWTDRSNGLAIGQLYHIANSTLDARVLGGYQDNGTQLRLATGTWERELGGDGMACHFHPTVSTTFYGCIQNGEIRRTLDNGITWTDIQNNIPGQPQGAWVTPYVLSPANPNTLFAGYNEVFRSDNQGNTWTQISTLNPGANLTAMAVAPSNPNILYVATRNQMWRGELTGGIWFWAGAGALPVQGVFISSIAVDPTNAMRVAVTLGRYAANSKVFISDNGGFTWTNISNGLPNLPAFTLAFNPCSNQGMYLGMDIGVYYRDASMTQWVLFNANLPMTPVYELEVHEPSGTLRAATFGRGVWQSPLWTDGQLTVTPPRTTVPAGSGAAFFSVSSDQNWTVASNSAWLFVSPSSGSNNGTFTASWLANAGAASRTAVLTVSGGGLTKMVTVTQAGTAAACSNDEEIRNGDLRNPPPLEPGIPRQSVIASATDRDYWRIDLTARANLTVALSNLPANYQLAVLDGAGVVLGSSATAGFANETVALTKQPAGTYYALVQSTAGSFNPTLCYTLTANAVGSGCTNDNEPANDAPTTAAPALAMGAAVSSQIAPGGDVDHWRFSVGSGISISQPTNIVLTLSDLPDDYDLEILSATGKPMFRSAMSGTDSERIEASLPTGTYYARVYGNPCAAPTTGCYTLRLMLNTPTIAFCSDPNEPANNAINTATAMQPGREYPGQLANSNDQDFWRFSISATSNTMVMLTDLHADLEFWVYNSAFAVIGASSNMVIGDESAYFPNLAPGTYFILVRTGGTYNNALCYNLKVATRPTGCSNDSESDNNSLADAPILPIGTTLTSRIESDTDFDIWAFPVPVSMTNVRVTLTNLGVHTNLVIRDQHGVVRGSSSQGGAADEAVAMSLPAGWYFVHITRPTGASTSGCYTLLVEADAGAICANDHESANNSPGTAPVLTLGTDKTSQIGSSTDRDWWRFTLTAPATVSLSLTNLPANYTLMLRTATSVLATSANAGTAAEFITANLGAGVYYAYVEGAGGAWSSAHCYTLHVSARNQGACTNSSEPANNTRAGAPVIGFSSDTYDQIGGATDQDFWRFSISGNQVAVVELAMPLLFSVNYDLQLQNANGVVLATSSQTGSIAEYLKMALSTGTYFLRVFSPGGAFTTADCYRLRVAIAPYAACSNGSEPANNSVATAPAVALNAFVSSQIGSATDQDFWKFNVYRHGVVHLNLFGMSADYDVYLFNHFGMQIGSSAQTGNGVAETLSANLGPGVYYALVAAKGTFSPSCYILEVSDRPWVRLMDTSPVVARDEAAEDAETSVDNHEPALVFPNPCTGQFRVRIPGDELCLLLLVDQVGRTLEQKEAHYAADFDLSGCLSGVYFVQIRYPDGRVEQKPVFKK